MEKRYFTVALISAIIIIVVQILIGFTVYKLMPDWASRGQFGDVFGVANALFSGLAFAGLIYAILLQREDLSLQRNELELTRKELERSAAAQEQSEIALKIQAASASQSAKLTTINFLLNHYKAELDAARGIAYSGNDPRAPRLQELRRREVLLIEMLDSLFNEVIEKGDLHEPV